MGINLYKVKYLQLPLFLDEIISLHSNNALTEYITSFKNYKIIILDDFGLTEINQIQLQALFALINCYYKKITFIITSQLPIDNWLNYLTEKTISEAILDRVLSNSLRVNLKGESFRWNNI